MAAGNREGWLPFLWLLLCHIPHTTSCSKTENPGVTAPGLPLFTRKSQFQNSLGFEEENPKSMEDLRVFTRRPPTDCSICRRCDQSNRCIRFSIPPLGGASERSSQPRRLRHLQGVFTRSGEAQWDGVDADVGLALLGSQKAELVLSAVHQNVATALHEVTAEGFHGGVWALVAE